MTQLTPADIVSALQSRGWAADIVTDESVGDMVKTKSTGILKCVDGRGSDNSKFGGPKLPGGIYAIAHNRHATKLSDVTSIAKEVASSGFVPSVHGDDSSDMLGCGFFKLWLTGRFDDMGYPRPEFDADQGAKAVKDAGGVIEMHHGKHTEKVVYINLCPNTTIEPDENDQRFVVDAWIGGKFNLDIPKFLIGAAATVEMLGGPKIAKIIVPSPPKPLTPLDICNALASRGWSASQVSQDEVSKHMVPTKSSGILKCVDGRGSDNSKFGGPKLPGGIYAIAHNRHATSLSDITAITQEVSKAGYVPSVHGDDSSDMLGCGFFKLWLTGRFDDMGYPRPEFDANQGANAVEKAGGVIEMHHGKHTEKVVYINLCPNTTIEPDENDQRFVVDAWIGGKFNLDIPKFLIGAAATVEMLGGPKIAKVIVPQSQAIIEEA
ncbi:hypothetical protein ACHAXN_010965 [Cyclotella atomus]